MCAPCEAASAETRPDQTDRTEKKEERRSGTTRQTQNGGIILSGMIAIDDGFCLSLCLSGLQNNNTGGFVLFAALIVIMQSGDRDRFELREGRGSMVTASRAATAKGGDRSLISGHIVFFLFSLGCFDCRVEGLRPGAAQCKLYNNWTAERCFPIAQLFVSPESGLVRNIQVNIVQMNVMGSRIVRISFVLVPIELQICRNIMIYVLRNHLTEIGNE